MHRTIVTVSPPRFIYALLLLFALIVESRSVELYAAGKPGEDWPTFLGPRGDGKSNEKGMQVPWPQEGPPIIWTHPLEESYGIGVTSKGLFYQFDRIEGKATLLCLNRLTGQEIWRFAYASNYRDLYGYNSGPRASPVVDGNRVYIYGVEGMLHCIHTRTGEKIWSVDVNQKFGVIQNFFGVGSTPVIHGDLLIVMVGGSPDADKQVPPGALDRVSSNGTGIVAFDKQTGKVRYKTADNLASYASLKLAKGQGRDWLFSFARQGLDVLNPATGKIDFQYPWRARNLESVNASVPVVVGDEVFISETYGPGSSLLRFRPGAFDVVWQDDARKRMKSMQTHWNTAICVDGYLYGSSGRHESNADLRCIEWKTGKVKWTVPGLTRGSLLYVDNHFVYLTEDGTLRLIRVNSEKYQIVSTVVYRRPADELPPLFKNDDRATRLLRPPAWAAPILSHGLLYVRGADRLVCIELINDSN